MPYRRVRLGKKKKAPRTRRVQRKRGYRTSGAISGLGSTSGSGAYRVNKNSLLTQDPPVVSNTRSGIRIKHREYITDVTSSTTFSLLQSIDLNPGLYQSFPWLSGVAENFTQYRFHGLIFEFISTSGSAVSSTNNSLGEVMMATNYNAASANFVNKQQMLNEEFSTSAMPAVNSVHPIECSPRETTIERLYVRYGAVPSGQDQRLYDLGNFQIATQGMQAGSITVGELYCSYDVEFFKPQLIDNTGYNVYSAHYTCPTANVAASAPLGTGAWTQKFDNIGLVENVGTGTTITFPLGFIGAWLLVYAFQTTSGDAGAVTMPAMSVTGGSSLAIWNGDGNAVAPTLATGSCYKAQVAYTFSITSPATQCVVTFGTGGTYPTLASASCDVVITQLNDALIS